ncbi:MAG TPA: ParB/RepB/Spo0J family partition protein [Candidatus Limnocylindrales bacterium]|nr:ParB/RepB/Spo0J family partition protein [Candidatus Limnocylindrales bacterium]
MTAQVRRPGGLGRGLAALIPQRDEGGRPTLELPISDIVRNPYQPRQEFDENSLDELAASIAEHGVLQPILVNETPNGYVLVAGERRLRASQRAGLERIPAVVRSVAEREQLALALVENLQRTDLSPLDEARAFRRMIVDFGLTQEEVAARVGRSRSGVANTVRLLDLPRPVQDALAAGTISEGHGRAIAGLGDEPAQVQVLRLVTERSMSVRQTEELVRRLRDGAPSSPVARPIRDADPELERIAGSLRSALGTKVTLNPARRGGRITIEYYDDEDLARLYERLTGAGL